MVLIHQRYQSHRQRNDYWGR